ncbi:MAG: pyruvate, phosphate dikinase [Deltaproteobacteria bacterium]|nr:pyruvate, phosphate dikinase [Deltaproteobacteria bacterium]
MFENSNLEMTLKKSKKTKKPGSRKKKFVYFFGDGKADGNASMKNLLGGKGANLAEMVNLSIPVPPGFTITTEVCTAFYENDKRYPSGLREEVEANLAKIEKTMGASPVGLRFGDPKNPLLLSVRSGARASMPGMMDTILNLGLNETVTEGIARASGNPRFAYDSYRRFIQMYSDVVMGMDSQALERLIEQKKESRSVKLDTELTADDWKELIEKFRAKIRENLGRDFPDDPVEQLWGAIGAVFGSWMTKRAVEYRRIHNIPSHWGTAVNVQAMVFGNMGNDCATGVAFTRDPSTGEKRFFGEYLINAQGEDVVAGIRTPQPINIEARQKNGVNLPSMEETLPECYRRLVKIYRKLESHYRDMQDIEFTVQNKKLWMLQTRNGKRTAQAAIKIAIDLVKEKKISVKEAIGRIDPNQLDQLLHPTLDPKAKKEIITKGLPASPGAASGAVVFNAEDAVAAAGRGEKVILVRTETSPEDIHGMNMAEGILTARGGMTSHAAVVARGMGKCCVAGCGEIRISEVDEYFTADPRQPGSGRQPDRGGLPGSGRRVKKGEWITLNGSTGEVMLGRVPTTDPKLSGDFATLMKWVDRYRVLQVRTNADTPNDARVARNFGAEGIGLCRTEHMFFETDRIEAVREMILADTKADRDRALAKILPMQKGDFKEIFRVMKGLPVTIRLLDPPLHEFLPHHEEELMAIAANLRVPVEKISAKNESLKEANPMLGHRGCRLGITFPEIYEMQTRAIMESACELVRNENLRLVPEIMIPLVGHMNELKILREKVDAVCRQVIDEAQVKMTYLIGTMIELPRAAVTADEIAVHADFFSFGTNDLTQTTFGLSRDDAQKFLPFYVENHILEHDPFVILDRGGVGVLIRIAGEKGRKVKKNLKMGICGEHGGEPQSIKFCHETGLDYVSCSPYRVPIARLSAAQAAIKTNSKNQ